jgi:hypothetical protein
MEVVVDGRMGHSSPEGVATFRSVLESIRRTVASRKRIVVSMMLDGEALSPERQTLLAERPAAELGFLEVRTVDPIRLSLETLNGLPSHVKNMERTQAEAATAADSGEYAKALEKFDAVFNGWDILLRAVRDVGALSGADFHALRSGDQPVETRIRELQDALVRFSASLEYKDVPAITEIIAKELTRALAHWRAIVDALSGHVTRVAGVSAT